MRMRFLLLFLIVFVSCTDAQVNKFFLRGKVLVQQETPEEFPAISGEGSFAMTDIVGENIPDLYYAYNIPAGANNALLVYVHGWASGGGIDGSFDPAAIEYLHSQGIGILGVGMRGRNTDPGYANNGVTVEIYRDAGALENYDVYKTIKYFIEEVAPEGQIDKTRIPFWVISGGGGAGAGCANKFPGLISTDVLWYSISKYGNYDSDPNRTLDSWYEDNVSYKGQIQLACGGVPYSSPSYVAGIQDEYYIARDHIREIGNSPNTKYHVYHDDGDQYVSYELSDALTTKMAANGQDYEYHFSTNFDYDHNEADLLVDKFSLSPQFGLHWVNDAKTVTRTRIPNTGTLYVPGYVIPVDEDLEPIFEYWIKSYRKNGVSNPAASGRRNQGKAGAATVTYNLTNNTFTTSLIKGNTTAGDQFFFVDITHAGNNVTALLATPDVVTLKPVTWNQVPAGIASDWKFYYDFSGSEQYLLDDASKVSNVWDLTGNNNFAFQETRATRGPITSGGMDNGVLKQSGTAGTLANQVDVLSLTGEFTIAISFDPDQTTLASYTDYIIGNGAGNTSGIMFTNFSGKIVIQFATQSNNFISNSTPANSNLGKQVWVIRRDASNVVTATCKNSTSTYTYTVGTSAGAFNPKIIGAAWAATKQFSGKIYKVAASDDRLSDGDVTTLLNTWYGNTEYFTNVVTDQTASLVSVNFDVVQPETPAKPTIERVTITGTPQDGQTLTAVVEGFNSPSGYDDATTYQWYRADNAQSTGSSIGSATSSTYVLTPSDVSKYIRCVVTPTDAGGAGDAFSSVYTTQISDDEFNPFTDLPSFTALRPEGYLDYLTNEYWRNDGTGGNSTRNGSDAIPTYSSAEGGYVDFESTNNEELILDQPGTQFTTPVTIIIRLKYESFNPSFSYPLAWTSAQRLEQRASGLMYLSGGNTSYTASLNKWTIIYAVVSGVANTSQFQVNWGTNKTDVAASTAAFGTANGRIGANSGGTGNRFDGRISHVFVIQGTLTAPQKAALQTWFDTYYPHEP